MEEEEKMQDEDLEEEEMSVEEITEENNFVLNALIDLLIEKNIISEEEFEKKLDSMEEEMYEDDEDSAEDSE